MKPDHSTQETLLRSPSGDVPEGSGASTLPSEIGRYRVLGVLGAGGMGVVYEGLDEPLGRRVAIKQLSHANSHGARRRLLREAQALARLTHPHVVALYEIIEAHEQISLVMELITGMTLRTWLAEREPTRAEVLEVFMQAGRGVAAAHAVKLVHRDLKPENVMIGADGRVRVMDFGLARATDADELQATQESLPRGSHDQLANPLTIAGARLGTPGYMAPEQYNGGTVDARSDVFSFCVMLHEALHGRRLFIGSYTEIAQDTLHGQIERPAGSDVPAWLDAVVRRGLALDPAARWPSMDALLAALDSDPSARRRRVLRAVGALALATGLAIGLSFGFVALEQKWEREQAERLALGRLRAVEGSIARAEAEGDRSAAEAAFRGFVADPAHQQTRAIAQAWLHRGDRRRDDPAAARADYAEAYVLAQAPEDAVAALRGLAGSFHATWDGPALGHTLALLEARGALGPDLDGILFDAALWQRDLDAAARAAKGERAAWRPMLEHLVRARTTELPVNALGLLPPGQPGRVVVCSQDAEEIIVLDADLAEVGRWRADARELRPVSETAWVVGQQGDSGVIFDARTGEALWRGPSAAPLYMGAPLDVTGDGAPDLVFGRSWPAFGFRAIDVHGNAPERPAHRATDEAMSAFESWATADLDGDGVVELATAIGAWHSFDLRLFHTRPGGELELLARRRIGRIGGLVAVRRGDKRLLAAAIDDSNPAPELFPDPPHTGMPAGIHLFEWTGRELVEVDFVPSPPAGFMVGQQRAAGDFDGDGREDLAFALFTPTRKWLLLLRQTEAGFEPLYLADVMLWGAAQLDDDAPAELLVIGANHHLAILGAGDQRLADLRLPPIAPHPPPRALVDPLLVERWGRAEELAALGMPDSAATSLERAAALAADPGAQLALLDRAAELLVPDGEPEAILALDRRVREEPELAARALARSTQANVRLGRYEEALADAESLLVTPGRTAEQEAHARALARELASLVAPDLRAEIRFDVPLGPGWRLHTPGALRRDPVRQALELTVPASIGPVAELPLEWDGGPLSLGFELDVERLEYGACLRVAILDETGEPWLAGGYCSRGGGGQLWHVGGFKAGFEAWRSPMPQAVSSGDHPRRILVHLAYFPDRGRFEVMFREGERVWSRTISGAGPRPGRHRLAIGAFVPQDQTNLALGFLRELLVRGARLAAPTSTDVARDAPARLLAENQPHAALEALAESASARATPHPRAAQIRLLAAAELRDIPSIAAAAPAVLEHMDDQSWLMDLVLALRARPLAAAALRSAAGPAILPTLASTWRIMHPHRNDPELRRRALVELQGVESLVPTHARERDAMRELLLARGRMWIHGGDRGRARDDLEAAAALALDVDAPSEARQRLAEVHLELALLLATIEPEAARAHARAALCLTHAPEDLRERLATRAALVLALSGSTDCPR